MFTRILFTALIAGIVAGICTAILQTVTTTPLIVAAEQYEVSAAAAELAGGERLYLAHTADDHGDVWAPADGLPRTLYTSLGTVGTTFGFALVLLSLMQIARAEITPRNGLLWGFAGFACTGLAPALGLSPELPGSGAADLLSRQVWWIGTALATAAGLWLALRVSSAGAIVAGVALILLPHLIGAPRPAELVSGVPAEISAEFAAASLVVHAVAWSLTGLVAGFLWQRGFAVRTA